MATGKGNKYLIPIIIIAIIVIILAVAIPMYRSSQVHDHLNAALDEAASAKLVVEEAAIVHGVDPSQLAADDIHWNTQTADSDYVVGIRVLDGGRIQVTTRNTGSSPDPVLVLTPTHKKGSAIVWHCSVASGSTSTLPDGCSAASTPASSTPATGASSPASAASASPTS